MGYNPFIGISRIKLESYLDDVNEEIATGKVRTSVGAGDVNTSYSPTRGMSPESRKRLIWKALNLIDEYTYPLASIKRQTVTVGRFRDP